MFDSIVVEIGIEELFTHGVRIIDKKALNTKLENNSIRQALTIFHVPVL